jgi:hypothetical protein
MQATKNLRKFKLHLIEDELVNKYICITFGLHFVQGLTKNSFPSLQVCSHYKKSRDFQINTQKRKNT